MSSGLIKEYQTRLNYWKDQLDKTTGTAESQRIQGRIDELTDVINSAKAKQKVAADAYQTAKNNIASLNKQIDDLYAQIGRLVAGSQ